MKDGAFFEVEDGGAGGARLVLSGPYLVSTIGAVDSDLRSIEGDLATVDLSNVSEIDTVGAWIASSLAKRHNAEIIGASERAQRLLAAVEPAGDGADIRAPRLPVWERVPERVGELVHEFGQGVVGMVGFLGQILLAAGSLIRHPSRFRGKAMVHQLELVGVSSLPIIGLMSFLIGIVIAQQGAVQLAQFGAETLTINLVGRITLRELGVLMTAIMVAGRSGSAFAAQLGTMKLTEEVDAMRTIGISPIEALVIPRILAAVLMMPLLGFFASCIAIIGGAVIGDLMLGRLRKLAEEHPVIGDVRGRGAMIAIELVKEDKTPDTEALGKVLSYCHSQGLILLSAGTYGNVIRMLPPLVIGDDLLNEGLDILAEAFARL